LHVCLGLAVIFQLGFQAETLVALWLHSPHYRPASHENFFRYGPEDIDYVAIEDHHLQGQVMTPARGISDCYDMDDFIRAETGSGNHLVMRVMQDWKPSNAPLIAHAGFASWSHIRLTVDCPLSGNDASCATPFGRMQVVLRQAYHPLWKAPGCDTYAGMRGNLIVDCPASRAHEGAIELDFRDATSNLGARTSMASWKFWLSSTASMMLLWSITGSRLRGRRWLAQNSLVPHMAQFISRRR
jgi:hypothetical protein